MDAAVLPPIARNIQQIRARRGLTLTGLSQRSGVAKSTLSLIESGHGNPTIETLWAIANALETPFGSLVEGFDPFADGASGVYGASEGVRFIERYGVNPEIEVYEMTIGAGHSRSSNPHPTGVRERVVVLSGEMLVGNAANSALLRPGQSHFFHADVEHTYSAPRGDAIAMVMVEYPGDAEGVGEYMVARDHPQTPAEWDGVRAIVDRAAAEVAQGLDGFLLQLRGGQANREVVGERLTLSSALGYRWPLLSFVDHDDRGVWLALLPQIHSRAFHADPLRQQPDMPDTLAAATRLAAVAERSLVPLEARVASTLDKLTSSPAWGLSTLASEVALQHGYLMLPSQLGARAQRDLKTARQTTGDDFASRFNVDHYDAFELLHPAYARQVVALAQDILTWDPQGARSLAIDVGSGPGSALLMLLELLPELRALAVEPDAAAFAYLLDNTKELQRVHCERCDFLELDAPSEPISVITSVGSSHHFNTAFMLQKAWQLLANNGILCIADELLPFFSDRDGRNNALIRHHATYVLASMGQVDALGIQHEDTADARLYRELRKGLVHAVLQATHGHTAAAVKRCRDLYALTKQSLNTKQASTAVGAFVRFYALEIQAMVAGFDFEIERKTHAKRLVSMAQGAGFDLVRHRRVYATSGADDWDGGTHVLTFRKNETPYGAL